jgi:F420-non-reducing hydrogenase iron-sulfur subunit
MEKDNAEKDFEPLIVAFLCNWCSYAGADFAGVSRYQYPPSVRIIRVMCSGRIDPFMVFRAFRRGADGVLVAGCHPGDCHYISGNLHAKERMEQVSRIIEKSKIPPQRFKLAWISASEGKIFAELIRDFTEELRKLGPLSKEVIGGIPTIDKVAAAENLFLEIPVRWLTARAEILAQEENVYGERLDPEQLKSIADNFFEREHLKHLILQLVTDKPSSLLTLSKKLGTPSREVFDCLVELKMEGLVDIVGFENDYPVYLHRGGATE